MGLDMYLYAQKNIPFFGWSKNKKENEDFNKLVELAEIDELIDKESGYISAYAAVQVGYWRKANAIHRYFVDKCADGKDDCEEVFVYWEQLKELMDICEKLSLSKDVEQAKVLLPPRSGSFFGGTDIDEGYFSDIEYTYNLLKKILEKIPEEDGKYEFSYRASW